MKFLNFLLVSELEIIPEEEARSESNSESNKKNWYTL
jgi:hypothetical protein